MTRRPQATPRTPPSRPSRSRRPSRRLAPRPKWFLIAVVLTMFCVVLFTDGFVNSEIGVDAVASDGAGYSSVPEAILDGGPIVDTTHDPVRSYSIPPKTVVLTFDDGPDPQWTPQVLQVLAKYHVPATFFVVGSLVAKHPDLVRDIRSAGSEVGVHTFTHPDLAEVPTARVDREMKETQLALAGAIGETSYLVRPPYSSSVSALTDVPYRVVQHLGATGYMTVLSDVDSRDWERPGTSTILRNSTPANGSGAIVLMHDAGGDRSETVAALDQLIPLLQKQGYTFTTVTKAVGLPDANQAAPSSDRTYGTVMLIVVGIATTIVSGLEWVLLFAGVLVILRLILMVVVAGTHRRRRNSAEWSWGDVVTDPVSVVVPAYNERECIESTVRSLVASNHPIEVVVVDDGSTDGTADLVTALRLANVRVIRQANAGKSAALNVGIAHARHDLIVMMDGDTVFEPTTVRRLIQPFADSEIGAVAGNAKIANRSSLVARWQHIEYVIGFNIDRRVYDMLRCMPTIPGASGAFRRSAVLQVGGVSDDTLAEDTDLTMALQRAGWRVVYQEHARAWTEAPSTLGQLWRQRYRWSYGTMQSMWKHRGAVLDRGNSGHFGRVGLLNLALFQVVLPVLAPLVDVFFIYGLIFLDPVSTTAVWLAVLAIQMLGGAYAFHLEREPLRALWLMPLQQIVYRQLMYAVLIQSVATALAGVRLRWQKLNRSGTANNELAAALGPRGGQSDRRPPRPAGAGQVPPARQAPRVPPARNHANPARLVSRALPRQRGAAVPPNEDRPGEGHR